MFQQQPPTMAPDETYGDLSGGTELTRFPETCPQMREYGAMNNCEDWFLAQAVLTCPMSTLCLQIALISAGLRKT